MKSRDEAFERRSEAVSDIAASSQAAALSATLDRPHPPLDGDALPPLWHWIFFRPLTAQALLAKDGHPKRGDFLPDLGLSRRMWAGGRLRFVSPIILGKHIVRESRVAEVTEKQGRSGRLGFVTVSHQIFSNGVLAIEEEHDIVYREAAVREKQTGATAGTAAPDGAIWRRTMVPDEALLFRYSALTFNAHRIHYDKSYATNVECYPGLLVHGPLIATLLLDLVHRQRPGAPIVGFSFKAIRPCFSGNALHLFGKPSRDGRSVELWTSDHDGWIGMTASANFA